MFVRVDRSRSLVDQSRATSSNSLSVAEKIAMEYEINRLLTRYCHVCDHGEASKVADLFTDDGIWQAGKRVMKGPQVTARGFHELDILGHGLSHP